VLLDRADDVVERVRSALIRNWASTPCSKETSEIKSNR
jgi:hypothetical protein